MLKYLSFGVVLFLPLVCLGQEFGVDNNIAKLEDNIEKIDGVLSQADNNFSQDFNKYRETITFSISEDEFINNSLEEGQDRFDFGDMFAMADVNSDSKISLNELSMIIEGTAEANGDVKEKVSEDLTDYFERADKNNDSSLDDVESGLFFLDYLRYGIRQQFKKMDRDGDGVYTNKDIPSLEESLEKLKVASDSLIENLKKIEETPKEDIAENIINSMLIAEEGENFYQADENKDECLDKDEYAKMKIDVLKKYNIEENVEKGEEERKRKEFKEIDKDGDGCMSEDEDFKYSKELHLRLRESGYTDDLLGDFDEEGQRNVYKSMVDSVEDKDNCFSEDDWMGYWDKVNTFMEQEYEENKKSELEYYYEDFDEIEKKDPNCLTKDEYIKSEQI